MAEAVLAWSGGKDAAFALHELGEQGVDVAELMTTFNGRYDRSSMHGVRRNLYERQAAALGLDLNPVVLPPEPSNDAYERVMATELDRYGERGIGRIVFADIFLEDVRAYREAQLENAGIDGCWPLWGTDTTELVAELLDAGFRATVVAVDGETLDDSFVGRELDEGFLADLPPSVDPCGENGEFHTFVHDGPIFDEAVPVETGETVTRSLEGAKFHYADLRSAE